MFPPSQGINLDIEAISGICGSISIACWVVVFSPQIVENFRRGSADGLSLQFIIVWLVGDVFNILGAVLQGVLPTMIILAVYYTIADIVLLGQCFYYRGFTWRDEVVRPIKPTAREATERTTLLQPIEGDVTHVTERRWSNVDATHLSPAMPLLDPPKVSEAVSPINPSPTTVLQATLFNLLSVLLVCAAGVVGWWLSNRSTTRNGDEHGAPGNQPPLGDDDVLQFSLWGQIFGYICTAFYIGSRGPQIILNYKRKSTEGVSMLFFIFACLGNLTYVFSIFAFEGKCHGPDGACEPGEASRLYGRYILVNASWLAGSLGTLFLDFIIFIQFFMYRPEEDELSDDDDIAVHNGAYDTDRPLLDRGDSEA